MNANISVCAVINGTLHSVMLSCFSYLINELNYKIMSRKIQVLVCKCGAKYAACVEPECYIDKDWLKDLKNHIKDGGTVEMQSAENFRFEQCKCNAKQLIDEPNLFS